MSAPAPELLAQLTPAELRELDALLVPEDLTAALAAAPLYVQQALLHAIDCAPPTADGRYELTTLDLSAELRDALTQLERTGRWESQWLPILPDEHAALLSWLEQNSSSTPDVGTFPAHYAQQKLRDYRPGDASTYAGAYELAQRLRLLVDDATRARIEFAEARHARQRQRRAEPQPRRQPPPPLPPPPPSPTPPPLHVPPPAWLAWRQLDREYHVVAGGDSFGHALDLALGTGAREDEVIVLRAGNRPATVVQPPGRARREQWFDKVRAMRQAGKSFRHIREHLAAAGAFISDVTLRAWVREQPDDTPPPAGQ